MLTVENGKLFIVILFLRGLFDSRQNSVLSRDFTFQSSKYATHFAHSMKEVFFVITLKGLLALGSTLFLTACDKAY